MEFVMRTLLGRTLAALIVAGMGLACARPAAARSEEETVRAAEEVLGQFLDLRVRQIPASMLADAHGVAIVPNLIKLGFVVGGQRGKGVVIVREKDGTWRAPLFITLTGGSIGWQAGAQSSDIILVFKTQKSVEGMLSGKFTLGADASVAAGPVGRRAAAATDTELKAEIYSYSRGRGLFAGVSIDGSAIQVDDGANIAYYGGAPGQPVPESAVRLVQAIANLTAHPEAAIGGQPVGGQPLGDQPFGGQPFGEQAPAGGVPTRAAPANVLPGDAFVPRGPDQPTAPAAEPRSLILSDPRDGPVRQPAGGAIPEQHGLQAELARSATSLSPLLDDSWRRYLALPADVFQPGRQPSPEALQVSVQRFESVLRDPQYRALAQRPEFQKTHGLLRAYAESLSAGGAPQLALPPPPSGPR
jgi:SH3 domain-containing YSC84-like protein 1